MHQHVNIFIYGHCQSFLAVQSVKILIFISNLIIILIMICDWSTIYKVLHVHGLSPSMISKKKNYMFTIINTKFYISRIWKLFAEIYFNNNNNNNGNISK
jgi:hypothetical protein